MSTKKTTPAKKSSKTTSKKSGAKNNTATVSTNVTEIETKAVKVSKKRVSLDAKSLPISAFIAEFVGTFILAAVALVASGGAIPMGFALVAIVLAIGAISGAHVNPLITVGAWVTRRISGVRAIGYILSQALGAMLALVVLTSFTTAIPKINTNQMALLSQQQPQLLEVSQINSATPGVWFILLAELIAAMIFSFIVASVSQHKNDFGAQALTVGFGLFVALTVAGGAAAFVSANVICNPAIALSLKAVTLQSKDVWPILVYILVPVIGGGIGFFLQDVLQKTSKTESAE